MRGVFFDTMYKLSKTYYNRYVVAHFNRESLTGIKMSNWLKSAKCRDADPELFFAINAEMVPSAQLRATQSYCCACPVQARCLEYALDTGATGIWAATTDKMRRAMRRQPSATSVHA